MLKVYKRCISPLLPCACRFHPTCSEYFRDAVEKKGIWKGGWMGVKRLCRCHPFHPGGYDPVEPPAAATRVADESRRTGERPRRRLFF